jgi:dihydroneopterin aldolase
LVKIHVKGLQLFGHHGVSREEREAGQLFEVDLELEGRWGARDELSDTADYVEVIRCAQTLCARQSFQLVESLARALAQELLERFPQAVSVRVAARKPRPSLPPGMQIEWFEATVVLDRPSRT